MSSVRGILFLTIVTVVALVSVSCFDLGNLPTINATLPPASTAESEASKPLISPPSHTEKPLSIEQAPVTPDGKYLFVELSAELSGHGVLPPRYIDFPHYRFSDGVLKPYRSPTLSPMDLSYVGMKTKFVWPAGSGEYSYLVPVSTLPYRNRIPSTLIPSTKCSEKIDVEVLAISSEGVIEINVGSERILIRPLGSWYCYVSLRYADGKYDGVYNVVYSIFNYGWRDRSELQYVK